jgi:hypothetical protein
MARALTARIQPLQMNVGVLLPPEVCVVRLVADVNQGRLWVRVGKVRCVDMCCK